jgi:hypothetical protein
MSGPVPAPMSRHTERAASACTRSGPGVRRATMGDSKGSCKARSTTISAAQLQSQPKPKPTSATAVTSERLTSRRSAPKRSARCPPTGLRKISAR